MNPLKQALSSDTSKTNDKSHHQGSLLKGVSRNKGADKWSLALDEDDVDDEPAKQDPYLRILNSKLQLAFAEEPSDISKQTYAHIIEEFQDQAGGNKAQSVYLSLIDDKVSDIQKSANGQFSVFVGKFSQMLQEHIVSSRSKDKSAELQRFDNLMNEQLAKKTDKTPSPVKQQKKSEFLKAEPAEQQARKSGVRDGKSRQKLERLLSNQKRTTREKKQCDDGAQHSSAVVDKGQNLSFSGVLSTSVAVKSRRKQPLKKQQPKPQIQESDQEQTINQDQKEDGDEAFMFFRPKKGKK